MAKHKLTEQDHLANKQRLAEEMMDIKTPVVIAGQTYHIGALTWYAKHLISLRITQIEVAESSIKSIVDSMALNIPLLAEILAIAILRDRKAIEEGLEDLKWAILESKDRVEWDAVITEIFRRLDVSFFFGLTERIKDLNSMSDKAGFREMMEKMKKEKQDDGYTPIQNLVKSSV